MNVTTAIQAKSILGFISSSGKHSMTIIYGKKKFLALADAIKPVGSAKYKELIEPYPEPEAFFESLKHEDDKYSLIRSNYEDIENSIKGIDANNGLEFILSRYGSGDAVILGVVTYILEGSDAATKEHQKRRYIYRVDGQNLN